MASCVPCDNYLTRTWASITLYSPSSNPEWDWYDLSLYIDDEDIMTVLAFMHDYIDKECFIV